MILNLRLDPHFSAKPQPQTLKIPAQLRNFNPQISKLLKYSTFSILIDKSHDER